MIRIKTQTPRSTRMERDCLNANMFISDIEIGVITTEGWGHFKEREEPLIIIEIGGNILNFSLSKFKKLFDKEGKQ